MHASVSQENEPQERQFSRLAIVGTAILPFGFLLVLFFNPISASTFPTDAPSWQVILRYAALLLAVIAPFASTILGFISMSQIRNSNGMVYGLPLAVFTSLFYPVILLSLFLVIIGWTFLASISGSSLIPLAWLFVILLIDYRIIRFTWRAAKR
jgi:hypothetical protein